jgi:hypothetical protein
MITYGDDTDIAADTTKSDSLMAVENNPLAREYYLKNLPFEEEELAASDSLILEAYFKCGKVYRDGLTNHQKSNESFMVMNQRFPENEHELISYYYLYKNYSEDGPPTEAEFYKNLILTKYPESDYALVLSDPEYYTKIEAEQNKVNVLYEETYKDYKAGQYFQVISKTDLAFSLYGDTMELAPNFAYLKAISVGKIDVVDSLVAELRQVIIKYPNSQVKPMAQNVLATIIKENPDIKVESKILPDEAVPKKEEEEKESPYKINPGSQHMFIIVANSKEIRLNPFKVKLSDYNIKYYSIADLKINSLVLDNEHYLITIGNFNNAAKAKDYYDAIVASDYIYADLKPGTFYNFVISTENYPIFFKEKDIGGYSKFFDKNYLK